MSATRVCGTGGGGGFNPKPGDPDNNIFISATPTFGGVDITLVYPETNPHAVAFVNLYRSTNSKVDTAIYHHKMVGTYFFDRNTAASAITYYYWAEMVSVNGTVMKKVGPVHASPRPMVDVLIEQLTGKIDAGLLANSLKEEVALIQTNKLGLDAEILARAATDDSLAASISETRAVAEDAQAILQQEVLARAEADSALVDTVNTLAVKVGKDIQAAIQQEQTLRAAADQALATQINTAQAKLGNDIASVQTTMGADIKKVGDTLVSIGALYTARVQANGLIGGFGVYNDGKTVEAGFDVDHFWVGRSLNGRVKPFMIEGNEVFINNAVINQGYVKKLAAEAITAQHINTLDLNAVSISGGQIEIGRNFSVSHNGTLKAANADITGTINGAVINGSSVNGGIISGAFISSSYIVGNPIPAELSDYNQEVYKSMDLNHIVNNLKKTPFLALGTIPASALHPNQATGDTGSFHVNTDGGSQRRKVGTFSNFLIYPYDWTGTQTLRHRRRRVTLRIEWDLWGNRVQNLNGRQKLRIGFEIRRTNGTLVYELPYSSTLRFPGIYFEGSDTSETVTVNGVAWTFTSTVQRSPFRKRVVGNVTLDYSQRLPLEFFLTLGYSNVYNGTWHGRPRISVVNQPNG